MTAFVLATPQNVDWWWSAAVPHIARVLRRGHGSYKATDVLNRLRTGQYRLWLAWGPGLLMAIAITEFCDYPQKRTCIVRMCGGNLPGDWNDLLGTIEAWAKDQGCSAMEVFGRKGWARALPGYDFQQVVMRKEL